MQPNREQMWKFLSEAMRRERTPTDRGAMHRLCSRAWDDIFREFAEAGA